MDSPAPATADSLANGRAQVQRRRLVGIAMVLYAILIATYMGAYAGGADSSGYLNSARLFREGRVRIEQRALENLPPEKLPVFAYVPLGFDPVKTQEAVPIYTDEMVPTYPVGLPLMIAAASTIAGWGGAAFVVMWLHAVFGVWLIFALAREMGLSFSLAVIGALLLAGSPLYLFMSTQVMSDTPSVVWCTAAVYFAWKSRRDTRWAGAAGVSVALAVLVRPSDLLVIVPVAISLGVDWRRWLWLVVGGAPGAVLLGAINAVLYGKVLTSGYGKIWEIFGTQYIVPSLENYAQWLPVVLTPGLALVVAAPWLLRRESARLCWLLATWPFVILAFYAFYKHTQESWWYLRFLLPAFPPFILIMLLGARAIPWRWPQKFSRVAMPSLVGGIVGWQVFWGAQLRALSSGKDERVYPTAAVWARDHLPKNALVVAKQMTGALHFYTPLVSARYDVFKAESYLAVERACLEAGRPIYAALFPEEVEPLITTKRFPGEWTQIGAVRKVTFWKYEPASAPAGNVR